MCNYEFICAPSLLVRQLRSFCSSRGSAAALSRALTFNFSPRESRKQQSGALSLAGALFAPRARGRETSSSVSAPKSRRRRISAPSEPLGSESRVSRRRMCCDSANVASSATNVFIIAASGGGGGADVPLGDPESSSNVPQCSTLRFVAVSGEKSLLIAAARSSQSSELRTFFCHLMSQREVL
jgi:hypothetical protein